MKKPRGYRRKKTWKPIPNLCPVCGAFINDAGELECKCGVDAVESPQSVMLSRPEDEVLFGGARGGGKSEGALMGALRYVKYPEYRAIFFRRTFPQIQDLIDRARTKYRLAYPNADDFWKEAKHRFQFPSGAIISFSHMEYEADSKAHLGKEYHYIGIEELTYFSFAQYKDLTTCLRSTVPDITPQLIATTNPGGPGHIWVKRYFVDPAPPGTPIVNEESGLTRIFIPAKVYDNPYIVKDYLRRLRGLEPRERKRQLEGDWDVMEGQAFNDWNPKIHKVPHRNFQGGSFKFISMDWGFSTPFAVGWYEDDDTDRLYKYREWYGIKHGIDGVLANVGIEKDAFWVGKQIKKAILPNEKIKFLALDRHCWETRGHSHFGTIADDLQRALDPIPVIKAKDDRISGKNQVHARLRVRLDGRPGLEVSERCYHTCRIIPGMVLDPVKDDVHKGGEDHIYDETRYACMARPMTETMVRTKTGRVSTTVKDPYKKQFEKMRVPRKQKYGLGGSYV